ncbi:MAG: hypothetical protein AABW63_01905 [Nanoarchaeota archaeon]
MSLNKRILGGIILVAGLAGIALTYKPAVNFFEDAAMSPTELELFCDEFCNSCWFSLYYC